MFPIQLKMAEFYDGKCEIALEGGYIFKSINTRFSERTLEQCNFIKWAHNTQANTRLARRLS